jgi:Ca2+-binding RTX toxin-like protein
LQFKTAPDFESIASLAVKNRYVVELVATDAFGLSAKQRVTIDVLNVNESPTWAENTRTVFVKDGATFVENVRGTHLLDPDKTDRFSNSLTPALTIGGADAKLFTSTRAGKLSFTSAAVKGHTLSAQGDYSYHLELIATDKGGLSTDTQYLTVQTVNILGANGNDTLVGTAANDRLAGLAGNDTLTGGAGADTFFVSGGKDYIADLGVGSDVLNVAAFAEAAAHVTASWTASTQTINLGTATLTANASVDLSAVASGNGFIIDAAAANLTLTGSRGADTFVLHQGMVDTVVGFESGKDSICLKGLTGMTTGTLASNAFVVGPGLTAASTADQRLILNTSTADLYFDADGNGDGAAILLAHFTLNAMPTIWDLQVAVI